MHNFFFRSGAVLLLIYITADHVSAAEPDSLRKKLNASGSFSLNSNGISSIPAFSLGDPAVVASLSVSKGRLSYDPTLAYGLDMKPWYLDSWLHYSVVDMEKFKIRGGFNFSMYFENHKFGDTLYLRGDRYWAIEGACFWYFKNRNNLSLMYWNDRGQDPGTIKGHFVSFAADWPVVRLGKNLAGSVYAQIFWIDYDGNSDGLFLSPKVSVYDKRFPFSLFIQATQAVKSNIEPFPGFNWNAGIVLSI